MASETWSYRQLINCAIIYLRSAEDSNRSQSMSSRESGRTELLDAVLVATRKLTGQGSLFSPSVAYRMAFAVADAEALEPLATLGRATARQIAERTVMTTGDLSRTCPAER